MGWWGKSRWTQTESYSAGSVVVAEVAVPVADVAAAALAEGASGVAGAAG